MMELENDVLIKCENCGGTVRINRNDIDCETSCYDRGENGMGDEVEYQYRMETDCPYCGNKIEFIVSGFEYPEGAFNSESSEVLCGGEFLEEPHVGIVYEDDSDFED